MGPFSSGKSSGCVIEIIRRAHAQLSGPDGIRRSRWVVVRNCYDDQTEILTEKRGWKLFKELLPDDAVATLDGDNLIYKIPEGVVSYPYSGEMFGFEGEGVNFLVTPEHKMWVSKRRTRKKIWGDYEVATADEIYGNQLMRVRRDAKWEGKIPQYSIDFFEFLGFWFAEGSCGEYNYDGRYVASKHLNITQKKHTLYVELLLGKNDFIYRKSEKKDSNGCFTYHLEQNNKLMDLWDMFIRAGKQPIRSIPQWVKDAPPIYIKAFLYGYEVGDGGNYKGTVRLSTCSKILADDLQELVLKSGGVANIGMSDYTGKELLINGRKGVVGYPSYKVTLLGEEKYRPILHVDPKMTNHLRGWHKESYDGMVYCVKMPLIPVYVRRKGKAFWCIRSYGQLKDTTIKTFHDWFPPKIFGEWRVTDHTFFLTRFPGVHLEVMFRALDRPDQVSNLLSLEVTGAWFNEVREIPKTIIEAMDSRIGRYPSKRDGGPTWHGMIFDTNPPDEDSYIYRMFEKVRPDNWQIFKQPSGLSVHAENTKNIPVKNYYQNLAKGKDEMYIRIYIHGQYGYLVSGKPVFQSFRDNIHVAPHPLEPMKGVDVLISFDFGLQPACVIGQLTPLGQLRILDELVADGMGIRSFCLNQVLPLLRQKYFGMNVMGYGDPSGVSRAPTDESTCFEVLHSQEIGLTNIVPAPTNAIMPRVGAVEFFLNKMYAGEPGFVLSPNCHFLRKAMNGAYHYDKDPKGSGDEYKPMPVKNFACVDMDTEILTINGWKFRNEIKVGDIVFGYKDGNLVKDEITNISDYEGKIKCVRFFSPRYEFIFTEDHKCLVYHRHKEGILEVSASDIIGNHAFVAGVCYKDDSHKKLLTNWFIKLCAWVFTEGHYRKDGSIVIVQSATHNAKYVEVIDKLLTGSSYLINRCVYNDLVRWKINKELTILIRYLMPGKCPSSEFIMKMRNSQRRLFLYECLKGDGFNGGSMPDKDEIIRDRDFWLNRKYEYSGDKITPRLTINGKHDTGMIQMIATLAGMETHIRTKRQGDRANLYDLSFIDKGKISAAKLGKQIVFMDKVWCPQTTTGTWVMRRKGIVLLTGNSHISDSLEYLCLYVVEKESYDKQRKSFLAQMKQRVYRPASETAGY